MSARKRREAPLPASGAGLLRFFEDETKGIKIRPEIVATVSIVLIITSVLIKVIIH
jgi:preprotein translocase subunit Sec61beta